MPSFTQLITSIRLFTVAQDEVGFSASQPPVPTATASSPSKSTGCETIIGFLAGGFGQPWLRPPEATPAAGACLPETGVGTLVTFRRGSCGADSANSLLRAECRVFGDASAPPRPGRVDAPTNSVDDRSGKGGLAVP